MNHFFVRPEQIGDKFITIEGDDVNHIKNVLRMQQGGQICVRNGQDNKEYRCEIKLFEPGSITAQIMWIEEMGIELSSRIYLFQGMPKGDKMEMIIQKSIELGVYEIIPMFTKRTVVKLDEKKEENKRRRWTGIAESAAKQSKRMIIPEVTKVMNFSEAVTYANQLDIRLIPYEMANGMKECREKIGKIAPGQSVAVFIGPEGGFDEQEIRLAQENGMWPVTLGRRILRTETAGLAALSILMYHLERD